MADFAASCATHESDFSNREWREVVVQHEALLGFALEALQSLHVVAGAEGGRDQCLGFTAREHGTAVSAGKNSSFNPNLADLVEGASIGTAFVIDDLTAENALAQSFVILLELCLGRGEIGRAH